ncbi:hypothetical protein [Paenibacillus elgii]|nr:hypothetical protein [Paenibacillus elgii]
MKVSEALESIGGGGRGQDVLVLMQSVNSKNGISLKDMPTGF